MIPLSCVTDDDLTALRNEWDMVANGYPDTVKTPEFWNQFIEIFSRTQFDRKTRPVSQEEFAIVMRTFAQRFYENLQFPGIPHTTASHDPSSSSQGMMDNLAGTDTPNTCDSEPRILLFREKSSAV